MTPYCCQRYAECPVTTLFQQDYTRTLRHAHATVELLCQEMPDFIASNLWPQNNPDLNSLYYEIWAVMQRRDYQRQIHSVDELEWQLIGLVRF